MQTLTLPDVNNALIGKKKIAFSSDNFLRWFIHGITKLVYRPTYIGFENIPATGPAILIANHVSYMDGPIIDAGCGRNVRYLIDHEIYQYPGVNYLMKKNRSIPISYNRKGVEAAFEEISKGLRAGDLVCLFPEGFLTYTGSLGRFRPGIEWITRRDPDVPVIPIALTGLWGSILSRKYRKRSLFEWPRHWGTRATAICGPAIPAEKVNVNTLQDVVMKLKYSISH